MSRKIESAIDYSSPEQQILSDFEQIELASWEMYIKVVQELGKQDPDILKLSNERLLSFCKLFDNKYETIISQLLKYIKTPNAPTQSNMFCTINNMGLIAGNGLDTMFMAALEHVIAKDPLIQEILDSVEFSRFDHIIESYVRFNTEQAMINLSQGMPIAQKLADYRQTFIFYLLEIQNN